MRLSTKKASAAALCMLLTVCISPLQAFAATSVNVGGKAYSAGTKAGDTAGTWAYDGADGMALNNYNGGAIAADGNLDITLTGANTVKGSYVENGYADGIFVNGDLSITGAGSLDVNVNSDSNPVDGIDADGDIAITGTTVNVNATSVNKDAYGVISDSGNITITNSTVTASANSQKYDGAAYVVGMGTINHNVSGKGIFTIIGSDVTAKATGASQLEMFGIGAYAETNVTSAPQMIISNSSVTAEGGDGAIVAYSRNASFPGSITITGSSIIAPTGAHVQDVVDSTNSFYGQTIGTGEGTITQFWLADGNPNPDVATSVTIAKAHNASQTSPKTADEAPIALLMLSLATAACTLFVARKHVAKQGVGRDSRVTR